MVGTQLQPMLGRVFGRMFDGQMNSQSDGQLLDLFLTGHKDAAFEALVHRHGPMVLATCRRMVLNRQDAEDAFQATFLVLVRKANSIRPRAMVGSWLYGVARKAALKARTNAARRGHREKQLGELPDVAQRDADQCHDLLPILEQALLGLPDKFRTPLVLCDLEGKTRKEAAVQLGWPEGTVAGRLAQARAMLARKLARHSPALSATALSVLLAKQTMAGILPSHLVSSLLKYIRNGNIVPSAGVSANAGNIAQIILSSMLLGKLKMVALPLIAILCLTISSAMLVSLHSSAEPTQAVVVVDVAPKEQKSAFARLGTLNWRHGEEVHCAALSNDGKFLATGGSTRLNLFNADQGRLIHTLTGQTRPINSLTFSPDGKTLLSSSLDGTLREWDTASGKLRRTLIQGVRGIHHAAYSPDGSQIAVGVDAYPDHYLALLHAESGKETARLPIDTNYVVFSPDGRYLATTAAFDRKSFLIEVATRRTVCELTAKMPLVNAVAFTPDSMGLVADPGFSEGFKSRTLVLWEVTTGTRNRDLAVVSTPRSALPPVVTPDGKILYIGNDSVDMATGKVTSGSDSSFVQPMAVTPDGRLLASQWYQSGTMNVIDRITDKEHTPGMGHRASVFAVLPIPNSNKVVTFGNDQMRAVWQTTARGYGEAVPTIATPHLPHAVAMGAQIVAVYSRETGTVLYDAAQGVELKRIQAAQVAHQGLLSISRDGKLLAMTTFHRNSPANDAIWSIQIVDADNDKIVSTIIPTLSKPTAVEFSPDNKSLLIGSNDGRMALVNVASGQVIGKGVFAEQAMVPAKDVVEHLHFSPDGKAVVTGTRNGLSIIWDVATGKELRHLPQQFGPFQYSPDGSLLASTDADFAIRLHDARTGEYLCRYAKHAGPIRCLTFTRDGRRLFSGSDDTNALEWVIGEAREHKW